MAYAQRVVGKLFTHHFLARTQDAEQAEQQRLNPVGPEVIAL